MQSSNFGSTLGFYQFDRGRYDDLVKGIKAGYKMIILGKPFAGIKKMIILGCSKCVKNSHFWPKMTYFDTVFVKSAVDLSFLGQKAD